MSLNYDASKDFYLSLEDIDTLVGFASREETEDNQENRILFLKLAMVSMVTKFQVFIESVLPEFLFALRKAEIGYNKIPIHMLLNSLKIKTQDMMILSKQLQNREAYKKELYKKIEKHLLSLNKHYSSNNLDKEFNVKTRFPLGKTGKDDLIALFRQFEGKNIFEQKKVDIDKIDSIFLKRNLIVHQDRCDQLTEQDVLKDQHYLKALAKHIDQYLEKKMKKFKII